MKPVTTADRLRADIRALQQQVDQLRLGTTDALETTNATFEAILKRLVALEDAVTRPAPEPEPPKPSKPTPPPGYVTVKSMCSEANLSYDIEASNMLRHYARYQSARLGHEVWKRPDVAKSYEHFHPDAARFAIDRVMEERAGETADAPREASLSDRMFGVLNGANVRAG